MSFRSFARTFPVTILRQQRSRRWPYLKKRMNPLSRQLLICLANCLSGASTSALADFALFEKQPQRAPLPPTGESPLAGVCPVELVSRPVYKARLTWASRSPVSVGCRGGLVRSRSPAGVPTSGDTRRGPIVYPLCVRARSPS